MGGQTSQFQPGSMQISEMYSVEPVEEINKIQQEELPNILSYIAESISREELKVLFHYLRKTQPIINTTLPILERKQKKYELSTRKLQRQELLPKYPTVEHVAKQQLLRQKQLQEQEEIYDSKNILGDSIHELAKDKPRKNKKKDTIPPEIKVEQEYLRQTQLQEQEDLYDQVDLLGEAIVKFHPLQSSSREYIEHDVSHADTIIPIPSEVTPETSSAPRRVSKYLSPEQVAQLRKIRKMRYDQQEQEYLEANIYGESLPNKLKDKYSFQAQNTRLQSPRELVFKKSIVNVKKNKEIHAKPLVLPVMNFPPTNWPTPVYPEIRKDLVKLRQEQRQYFIAMQQVKALEKLQDPDHDEDENQNIIEEENLRSIQNQQNYPRQNQNTYSRNMKDSDDEENISFKKERYKFMKCVYLLLFVQWLSITGIVSLFKYHEPSSLWLESSNKLTWLYILCTLIVVIISFMVLPAATHHCFPMNLMMLTFFTLLVAFMFSFVEIFYPNDSVIFALGCTCLICVVLALVFCQKRCNFTIYCGLFLCSVIIILFLGTVNLLINASILEIVYAAIGVSLYSIYIVWNTNAIVKEESQFHIEYGNFIKYYIAAAIHLNLDFIFIIIEKLVHN